MIPRVANGAELLCNTLEYLGVKCAFGVPGTQNVLLYEALRRSAIRPVLATHELAASFMANGYYRASGRVAPLITIPGPGFTYALTGLAEALHDSAALLHVVGQPPERGEKKYEFQALEQEKIAAPLVKRVYCIRQAEEISRTVAEAYGLALSGEPGPVLLQWSRDALAGLPVNRFEQTSFGPVGGSPPGDSLVEEAATLLGTARRPVLFVGQGAVGAAGQVQRLAELIVSPVFTTASGRGVLPEDHALALGFDLVRSETRILNEMIRLSDCIVALGCKLTSAGTGGYQVELPSDRLIRVDASEEVLGANYPARLAILGSVETVLDRLLPAVERKHRPPAAGWACEEIEDWKKRLRIMPETAVPEPVFHGVAPTTAGSFIAALRRVLPRNGIVVTDSGLHQGLVRRHFDVLAPRGLILPSDFQSMGFGLPAAIGAKLAAPERRDIHRCPQERRFHGRRPAELRVLGSPHPIHIKERGHGIERDGPEDRRIEMEFEIDHGRPGDPHPEFGGELGRHARQGQVFPKIPDSPLGPVPSVADLKHDSRAGKPGKNVLEEPAPGSRVEHVVTVLKQGNEAVEAPAAEVVDEFFMNVQPAALPGGDANQGQPSSGFLEEAEYFLIPIPGIGTGQPKGRRDFHGPGVKGFPITAVSPERGKEVPEVRSCEPKITPRMLEMVFHPLAARGYVVRLVGEVVPGKGEAHPIESSGTGRSAAASVFSLSPCSP